MFCWPFGKYVYLYSCRKFDTTRMSEEWWQSSHGNEMFNFNTIPWTVLILSTSLVFFVLSTKTQVKQSCHAVVKSCHSAVVGWELSLKKTLRFTNQTSWVTCVWRSQAGLLWEVRDWVFRKSTSTLPQPQKLLAVRSTWVSPEKKVSRQLRLRRNS